MDSAALSFTDKETHFIASKQEHNISLESCPPYAHWKNGILVEEPERGYASLLEKPWYKTKIIKKNPNPMWDIAAAMQHTAHWQCDHDRIQSILTISIILSHFLR